MLTGSGRRFSENMSICLCLNNFDFTKTSIIIMDLVKWQQYFAHHYYTNGNNAKVDFRLFYIMPHVWYYSFFLHIVFYLYLYCLHRLQNWFTASNCLRYKNINIIRDNTIWKDTGVSGAIIKNYCMLLSTSRNQKTNIQTLAVVINFL